MKKTNIQFIAWSDIHYANYGSGIKVEDVYAVEESITDYIASKPGAFGIFAGDRYLSHTPSDSIRVFAERSQRRRNDLGIVTFSLLGNHDWQGKSDTQGHSNRLVQDVFMDHHPNLVIMDKPATYEHSKYPGVLIHALPAGFHFDWNYFRVDPSKRNILVFHDMLQGCQIDVQTGFRAPHGVSISELDHDCFDFVVGGDIHIPQKLPFKNTRGGYCGSPIQQSRRDRGGDNGWFDVILSEDDPLTTFVSSKIPRFVDFDWTLSDENLGQLPIPDEIRSLVDAKWGEVCEGNIVDINLTGPRHLVDFITDEWREMIRQSLGARRVNPPLKKVVTQQISNVGETTSVKSPVEEFGFWLGTGRAPVDGFDINRLLTKATSIIKKRTEL